MARGKEVALVHLCPASGVADDGIADGRRGEQSDRVQHDEGGTSVGRSDRRPREEQGKVSINRPRVGEPELVRLLQCNFCAKNLLLSFSGTNRSCALRRPALRLQQRLTRIG